MIGIAGGSGSGKTTLANQLMQSLEPDTPILSLDDYYKPLQQQTKDENGFHNFDLPSGLNLSTYEMDLKGLKKGNTLMVEKYDFNNGSEENQIVTIAPEKFLITEGIFLLESPGIIELMDVIIFVDTELDIMYKRRLKRDEVERKIARDFIEYQWLNHFVPAYEQFILPKKHLANLIVSGNQTIDVHSIIQKMT